MSSQTTTPAPVVPSDRPHLAFGYDHSRLTRGQLSDLLQSARIPVPNDAVKADLVVLVERMCIAERDRLGISESSDYLLDADIDVASSYKVAELRQILTRHGIEYPQNASKAVIVGVFRDNLDTLRAVGHAAAAAAAAAGVAGAARKGGKGVELSNISEEGNSDEDVEQYPQTEDSTGEEQDVGEDMNGDMDCSDSEHVLSRPTGTAPAARGLAAQPYGSPRASFGKSTAIEKPFRASELLNPYSRHKLPSSSHGQDEPLRQKEKGKSPAYYVPSAQALRSGLAKSVPVAGSHDDVVGKGLGVEVTKAKARVSASAPGLSSASRHQQRSPTSPSQHQPLPLSKDQQEGGGMPGPKQILLRQELVDSTVTALMALDLNDYEGARVALDRARDLLN